MTKTIFWLSILAISVVLIAGSLAVSPIAIAGGDDDDDDDDDGGGTNVILQKLDQIIAIITSIFTEVTNIEGKLDGTVASKITEIDTEVTNIEGKLDGTVASKITEIDTEVTNTNTIVNNIQTDLLSKKSFYEVEDIVNFIAGPDKNFDVLVSLSCPGSVPADKQAFNIETMGVQVSPNLAKDRVAFFNSTVIDQSFGVFYAEAVSTFIGSELVSLSLGTTIGASDEVRFGGNVVNTKLVDSVVDIKLKAVAIGEKPQGCDVTIDADAAHLGLPLPPP